MRRNDQYASRQEVSLPLTIDRRTVGKVAVVRCNGRITAGDEADSLRVYVCGMFANHKDFILHLGDVGFIDSSGLGTVVRLQASARRLRGDLKLCNVPPALEKVLRITNLTTLFEIYESEEHAIRAFYSKSKGSDIPAPVGVALVCVDKNADLLTYLKELLRRAGYDLHPTCSLSDALMLIRVTRPRLVLVGPSLTGSSATLQAITTAFPNVAVIEMGCDFSKLDAGEAASRLLQEIQHRLQASTGSVTQS
ncbi:MAG TPA: anti-sigma factor antagonist [Terriglobales bacterium]|nr:anti-sigma factor antagonist [Terriglobales bacterium]